MKRAALFRALRHAAEEHVDEWTRVESNHLNVPQTFDGDDPTSKSSAHDCLALFLARFFRDSDGITRIVRDVEQRAGLVPPALTTPLAFMEVHSQFDVIRGIALNVWVHRVSTAGFPLAPVRIFQDYRRVDGEFARIRFLDPSIGDEFPAQDLWFRIAHRPYFALTRALERLNRRTLIAFLAAHVDILRADLLLGLSFGRAQGRGLVSVPPELDLTHDDVSSRRAFYTQLDAKPDTWIDAASAYLYDVFGVHAGMSEDEVEGAVVARLGRRRRAAEAVTTKVMSRLFRRPVSRPMTSQCMVMLGLLKRFYMVTPDATHFYVLPIFHTAKPSGDQARLRTLSTVGITASAPLDVDDIELLQAMFNTLTAPLQMTDYRIQEEARAVAGRAGRFTVLIHHIKHDVGRLKVPLRRYQQLLELAHDPRFEAELTKKMASPAQLAAERHGILKVADNIVSDISAALSHPDDVTAISTPLGDVFAWIRDHLIGREMVASVSDCTEHEGTRIACAAFTAGMAVIELVRNSNAAGRALGSEYCVDVTVRGYRHDEDRGYVGITVSDSCGGFEAARVKRHGLRGIEWELEQIVRGKMEVQASDRGTAITLWYPLVTKEDRHGHQQH